MLLSERTRVSYPHLFSWVFQNIQNFSPTLPCFPVCLHSHCGGEFRHDIIIKVNSNSTQSCTFSLVTCPLSISVFLHCSYTQTLRRIWLWRTEPSLSLAAFCLICPIVFLFGVAETFTLAAMAYDTALWPSAALLYTTVMSPKRCALLVAGSYSWGVACSMILTYFLLALSYCKSSTNNFICDRSVIVSVSCSDPYITQMLCSIIAIFNESSSLVIILMSYIYFVTVMPGDAFCKWVLENHLHLCFPLAAISIFTEPSYLAHIS